jgi:hypothetical protein
VLDGEPAVPCNPEPALPGSNSHLRFFIFCGEIRCVMLKIRSCATQARPTPPGPEGSNGKRILECAAGKPGWSRLSEIPQKIGIEGGCTESRQKRVRLTFGGTGSWFKTPLPWGRGKVENPAISGGEGGSNGI